MVSVGHGVTETFVHRPAGGQVMPEIDYGKMAAAVFQGMRDALSSSPGGTDVDRELVLKVNESELGRVSLRVLDEELRRQGARQLGVEST